MWSSYKIVFGTTASIRRWLLLLKSRIFVLNSQKFYFFHCLICSSVVFVKTQELFEEMAMRIRKSKRHSQHKLQAKMDRMTNNDLQNTRQKTKDWANIGNVEVIYQPKICPLSVPDETDKLKSSTMSAPDETDKL